jgi:hypothetical protein
MQACGITKLAKKARNEKRRKFYCMNGEAEEGQKENVRRQEDLKQGRGDSAGEPAHH